MSVADEEIFAFNYAIHFLVHEEIAREAREISTILEVSQLPRWARNLQRPGKF